MTDAPRQSTTTSTFWSRFWYYTAWRVMGLLLAALAVRNFWSGDAVAGFLAGIFAVTYIVLMPANLLASFRFGYSVGMSDTLAYTLTNDQYQLRPDVHPAEVADVSLRRHAR